MDGLAEAFDNLDIEYTYHSHNDSCYTEVADDMATFGSKGGWNKYCSNPACCPGTTPRYTAYGNVTLKSGKWYAEIAICNVCGIIVADVTTNYPETILGYSFGTYSSMTCGKTEASIESVTINY